MPTRSARRRPSFHTWILLASVLLLAVVVTMVLPALRVIHDFYVPEDMAGLRNLHLAILMYSARHQGAVPDSVAALRPHRSTSAPAGVRIARPEYDTILDRARTPGRMDYLASPGTTLIAWQVDGVGETELRWVVFANGRIERLAAPAFRRKLAEVEERFGPKRTGGP